MSIRLQQLFLLLGIALLPVLLSGWQSLRQIDHMADSIAESTRKQTLDRNNHYMREKVADIGTGLQLLARNTELLLRKQRRVLEHALSGTPPGPPLPVIYSDEVASHPDTVEDTRFSHTAAGGGSSFGKVHYPQASFRLPPENCATAVCALSIQLLAGASGELKNLYQQNSGYSLWHIAGLANGSLPSAMEPNVCSAVSSSPRCSAILTCPIALIPPLAIASTNLGRRMRSDSTSEGRGGKLRPMSGTTGGSSSTRLRTESG